MITASVNIYIIPSKAADFILIAGKLRISSNMATELLKYIEQQQSPNGKLGKELEMQQVNHQKDQKLASRCINYLPLYSSANYTPHSSLDFDLAVQEYCRKNNHSLHYQGQQQQQQHQKQNYSRRFSADLQETNEKVNSYDATNTPFNKVTRNCKIVVSGDVAVGKTCLVNRFGHDVYTSRYQTTIGVDFDIQKFTILGQPFALQIWDTAGLERFKCITNSYYRGCQAALLVFDMSNLSTLANVLRWKDDVLCRSKTFEQLNNECNSKNTNLKSSADLSSDQPLLFLVGTKSDLPLSDSSRRFIEEQANKIASLLQAELWFVSAETGENVNELFGRVASLCFNRAIYNEIQRARFEMSTLGACLKEKILQQQKELWQQSSRLIKITRRKEGDDRRSRCVNVQCVIK